jgi:PAS domain S-box-containing protein
LPLLLWAAFRFGAAGVSAALLAVTITLMWRALNGPSPFIAATPEASALAVQLFLTALAVPLLLLGAAIDDGRKAQRASRESEQHMTLAATAADVGLWRFDLETDQVWITDHGRCMLGLPASEPVAWNDMMAAIHPEDRAAAREALRPSRMSDELTDTEFRVQRSDGATSWMRARARAESGDPAQISGTLTDITDRKAAESQIAEQRRELAHLMRVSMLGELSGGIAHEITQPLAAIMANAQAARLHLKGMQPNLDEIAAALDDIVREDTRAGEVIQRMRGFLKREPIKREPVDVNELIPSTLRLVNSELIARGVTCRCELSDGLPPTAGDPVQLQQVLLNLVMNAMEAVTEGASLRRIISLRTGVEAGHIRIRISDSGPGLSAAQERQAFQPFFTTKQKGLGLGLAICSSIIGAHGGTLTLENNPGGGATASVVLAASQDAHASPEEG